MRNVREVQFLQLFGGIAEDGAYLAIHLDKAAFSEAIVMPNAA
jgi:hypothetical protein